MSGGRDRPLGNPRRCRSCHLALFRCIGPPSAERKEASIDRARRRTGTQGTYESFPSGPSQRPVVDHARVKERCRPRIRSGNLGERGARQHVSSVRSVKRYLPARRHFASSELTRCSKAASSISSTTRSTNLPSFAMNRLAGVASTPNSPPMRPSKSRPTGKGKRYCSMNRFAPASWSHWTLTLRSASPLPRYLS